MQFWHRFSELLMLLVSIGFLVQLFFVHRVLVKLFIDGMKRQFIITKDMQVDDEETFDHWVVNNCSKYCGIEQFSYYIFNITNPVQVTDNGSFPRLQEIGPFVFFRTEVRRDPIFNNDSTVVNYTYHYRYIYSSEYSTTLYNLSDMVYVISPFWLYFTNQYRLTQSHVSLDYLQSLFSWDMYLYYNISQILFDAPYNLLPYMNKSFSLINTTECRVSEYTGRHSTALMRQLIQIYGQSSLNFWAEPEIIAGSRETKQFAWSNIWHATSLSVYSFDKSRVIDYIRQGTTQYEGVSVYKFIR
ncbi:hypothetical protein RFI_14193 [Reticulomyxa filosa]|uniref:Uncharacterized protein n=1 Tax=Reticulomyxa filosa TaxID=46433 RepID=X6NCE8_RETFI|nr:hypothetical protein RFI_14193 [Reticulomyxa filosa]|eukprot:ETO22992.1 hypothetical protein RFI_14193 [Reticulomyxa filosa]